MAKTSIAKTVDEIAEDAWLAGITFTLVTYCGIDSAKVSKLAKELADRPNTLGDRKRAAREKLSQAITQTAVEIKEQVSLF